MAGPDQKLPQVKNSSAMLYLNEELGDARLRCDQLTRYIVEAVKLINESPKKDHFFEVAGHLLQGIPETAFKLQKALQAVALAADHMDYEELKQELRPEKVDELEKILKEVRIRPVIHRSEIPTMTPNQVATQLKTLAKTARETGCLPLQELAAIVGQLDNGRTASAPVSLADTLDKIAGALEGTEAKPSKIQLANLLARVAMEAEFDVALRQAGESKLTQEVMQLGSAEEVKKKFKAENPALSDEDLNKIAEQWEKNKDVVKDKTANADRLERLVSGIEDEAKEIRSAFTKFKADPGKNAPQLDNVKSAARAIETIVRAVNRTLGGMKTASVESCSTENDEQAQSEETKQAHTTLLARVAALTERLSAALLWQYKDEDGKEFYLTVKRKGTIRSPYSGKSFTADPKRYSLGDVGKELKADEAKVKGALWKYTTEEGDDFYLPERLTTTLRSPFSGKTFKPKAEKLQLSEVGKNLRDEGKKASSEEAKLSRFEEGKPADPTVNMSPEDKAKWEASNEKYKDKFKAASDEVLAWKA